MNGMWRVPEVASVLPVEFAALMANLGPFSASRRVAVAVSGGADSLCLAVLAAHWGKPLALIVDHALRPEAAAEAAMTRACLSAFGVESRILRLDDVRPGPGLAARARAARYAALTGAACEAGLTDLLLGHHAGDQAETIALRRESHSRQAGLAGMARIVHRTELRLLRPLLGTDPARLRATLRRSGMTWVEDPSNSNIATARGRIRADLLGEERRGLLSAAAAAGMGRLAAERRIAGILAQRANIRPEGFALLSPGPIEREAFAALVRCLAGAPYTAPTASVAGMAARPRAGVLGGVQVMPAGRLGAGWLLLREPAAMGPAVPAVVDAIWDRRFRLVSVGHLPSAEIGPLGADAAALRHLSDLPAAVLSVLPAIRSQARLVAVPHIGYAEHSDCLGYRVVFSPPNPASGLPFGL